jgi:predicted ATPase
LDGPSLPLSSNLNTLIGIRGSGKSTLLECLRYILDLPVSAEADPDAYKPGLVERALGSGGKIIAELHTRDGVSYRVEHYAPLRQAIERSSAGLAKIDAALPEIATALTDAQSGYRAMETIRETKKERRKVPRRRAWDAGTGSAKTSQA